jgi:hypothetical protein
MENDMKLNKFSKGKLLNFLIINYFRFKILGYYWVFCALSGSKVPKWMATSNGKTPK